MTGTGIEKAFVEYLRENYALEAFKLRIDGVDGFPDRSVIVGGRIFLIEFKSPNEKLRPQQRKIHGELKADGTPVFIGRDLEESIKAIEEWILEEDEN